MSTESNRLLLKHHLEKLRLPTVWREWEGVASSCAKDGRDYGDFLLQLTERELIEREQRAAGRRIKSAKFPVIKNLENFDFAAQSSINETLIRQLASGEYLEARENVLLIGNSGTGKTHLPVRWVLWPAPREKGSGSGARPLWSPTCWRCAKPETSSGSSPKWENTIC